MRYLRILNLKQKQKVIDKLNLQFGVNENPGILLQRGAEKFFLFQGDLNPKEIFNLENIIPLERIGIYFAKEVREEIRLSIEATQILKSQIKKNIFELNQEQMKDWMLGKELQIKTGKKGFLVMKYKGYFLGCGKASELKIGNFIPKTRRLKRKNIIK